MKFTQVAIAASIAVWPANGAAENVRPQDPASIVKALQEAGYPATLSSDGVGDPMVQSQIGATTFQIFLYNCVDHQQCATVQFHSAYHVQNPIGLDQINQWNSSQRFGRAYLDKANEPNIEMDVDLDDGGEAPLLFIDNIEFWKSLLPKFETLIGYHS